MLIFKMTIFNNNIKNSRDISCDSLTLTTGGINGKFLMSKDNGEAQWTTGQSISTISFLVGVTLEEIELEDGAWIKNNGKDESSKLNDFLAETDSQMTKLGFDNNAFKTIVVESPKGFIYLNDRISIPNKINLEFKCFVACGQNFNLQMSGQYSELPPSITNAPVIVGSVSEGDNTIVINMTGKDNPSFTTNDLIAIRSTSLNQRQDNQVSSITVLGTPSDSNFTINLAKPIDGFDIANNDGTVRKYNYNTLSLAASRGDVLLKVVSASSLFVGQYIAVIDRRRAGDYAGLNNVKPNSTSKLWYSNNQYKYEIRLIIEVDTVNNTVQIESPLSNDFDTTNTYILTMKPRHDAHIKGLKFFYVEAPTYPRNNRHGITLDTCVNCSISDITFSDCFADISSNVQHPNINNLIRLRETHSCVCENVNVTRSKSSFSASGAGYMVTSYYNSYTYFNNLYITGGRHAVLLQSAVHNTFNNVTIKDSLISSFDFHGLNERDNTITNLYIDVSKGQHSYNDDNTTTGNTTVGMIRLGNTTHPTGASYNNFDGVTLKYGLPSNIITTVYGVELVPRSIGNTFNNMCIENCDVAVACYDHPKGRLNTNLITASNTFNNCIIKDCNKVIDVNGADNIDGSYAKVEGTINTVVSANTVRMTSSFTLSEYVDMFNGWILQHSSGSNYTISSYNATTKEIGLSTNFAVTPTVGQSIVLRDSLTVSIKPVRDFTFTNSVILRSSNVVSLKDCTDVRLVNNYINSNSGYDYAIDCRNVINGSIYGNKIEYTKRFYQGSNTSNIRIVDNHLINLTDTRMINDLGANSNITWKHIHTSGFTPTYNVNDMKFTYDNTNLGYKLKPSNPLLNLDNSNGYVGINTNAPESDLHIKSSRNLSSIFQSTSTNYCAVSLMDANTTSSNMCQIRGSNNLMVLRGNNSDTLYLDAGRVGIGKQRTAGRMHIYESTATLPFFNFDNNAQIDTESNNLNTHPHGSYYGRVMVRVEGVGNKWLALYD